MLKTKREYRKPQEEKQVTYKVKPIRITPDNANDENQKRLNQSISSTK